MKGPRSPEHHAAKRVMVEVQESIGDDHFDAHFSHPQAFNDFMDRIEAAIYEGVKDDVRAS